MSTSRESQTPLTTEDVIDALETILILMDVGNYTDSEDEVSCLLDRIRDRGLTP